MAGVVKGSFKLGEQTVEYEFQVAGKHNEVVGFRMQFSKVPVKAETAFVAGVYLMHFLANDYGMRLDIQNTKPKLPSEQDMIDSVEGGPKQ